MPVIASGIPVNITFYTADADGNDTAADSLPTGFIIIDGETVAGTVTVTDKTGGRYKANATVPTSSVNQFFEISVTAIIGGVTQSDIVFRGIVSPQVSLVDDAINSQKISANAGTEIANAVAALVVSEPSGEAQFGTTTLVGALGTLLVPLTNKKTFNKTTGVATYRNNADDATLWTTTATDDGTTRTVGKAT